MKRLLTLLLTSCALLSASAPHWNLKTDEHGWNSERFVTTYFHNSELQRQWAFELLGKVGLRGDERVLDFGCGDGKISALISQLVPRGSVEGVDLSKDMLRVAKLKFPSYAYPNLTFCESTSALLPQDCDLLCAFCVFHLVADPVTLLQSLKPQLKADGKLLLVIPAGKNPLFFAAAGELMEEYGIELPWKGQDFSIPPPKNSLEGWEGFLQRAGYAADHLAMVDTDNPFYSREEFLAWLVGTMGPNWNIPYAMCEPFFSDLIDRVALRDSTLVDEEGRIHWKCSRIHVIAHRE